jgi:hypothetical protein
MPFFLLFACQSEPPGVLSTEVMDELWVGVSPDNLAMLYFLARTSWADESCPSVLEDAELGTLISADGCTDDWGNTWTGELGLYPEEGFAKFEDFGVDYTVQDERDTTSNWTYDGEVSWSVSADTAEVSFIIDGTVDFTRNAGETRHATVAVIQADALLNRQVTIMELGSGEVTLPDWGSVEYETDGAKLSGSWGCDEPTDGTISLSGDNSGALYLADVTECGCPMLELEGDSTEWCDTRNRIGWAWAI